jgi:hypothetical protein
MTTIGLELDVSPPSHCFSEESTDIVLYPCPGRQGQGGQYRARNLSATSASSVISVIQRTGKQCLTRERPTAEKNQKEPPRPRRLSAVRKTVPRARGLARLADSLIRRFADSLDVNPNWDIRKYKLDTIEHLYYTGNRPPPGRRGVTSWPPSVPNWRTRSIWTGAFYPGGTRLSGMVCLKSPFDSPSTGFVESSAERLRTNSGQASHQGRGTTRSHP